MIHEKLKQVHLDGVLKYKLPVKLFDYLKNYMGDSPDDFSDKNPTHMGKHLAGNINEEYLLHNIDSKMYADIVKFYTNIAREYHDTYELQSDIFSTWDNANYISADRRKFSENMYNFDKSGHVNTLYMESFWGNYQKKYEFNPPHQHSGIYSFVLFVNIPYDLEKEMKYFPRTNSPFGDYTGVNSCFTFRYHMPFSGKIVDLPIRITKDYEGTGFFFPSYSTHGVNPFYTSDDYRITISGNLHVKKCLMGKEEESLVPPKRIWEQ